MQKERPVQPAPLPRLEAGRRPRLATKSGASSTPEDRDAPPQLKDLRVLVVDDDPGCAKLASVLLRGDGCDVRTVHSAEEALVALESWKPRIMVLDLVLPLMSGLLLAQRLKVNPATRDIVIIAVSAFNGAEAERLAIEAGCSTYVRKPIDAMSFTQLLLTQLEGIQ